MTPDQTLVRRLYFRGFAVVYLVAFLSLWSQLHDLIGAHGLLPADDYFQAAYDRFGSQSYWLLPSLCWFNRSDLTLHLFCAVGVMLSAVVWIGWAPRAALTGLWAIYLSLSLAGQEFLSFQWDTLLLEMTLCSWLYAPKGVRPDWKSPSTALASWPLWGLAFKLMFLSGITKLLSGDASWLDGTALEFHYYTQPIPSWLAWYMSQLPRTVHHCAVWLLLFIEVVCPFLVFAGQRGRMVFGLFTIALMLAIEATGNFGFFNLQTVVLCVPLLDDQVLLRLVRRPAVEVNPTTTKHGGLGKWSQRFMVFTVLSISLLSTVAEMSSTSAASRMPQIVMTPIGWADTLLLSWGRPLILKPLSAFRTINGYGLFRVMTTRRAEIVIETSDDGIKWTECEFPYKPGRIDRAPPVVAPHMPRLDWQMWFAALNMRQQQRWLSALLRKIPEGNLSTARLLGHPEFAEHPPKHVRMTLYEYNFTAKGQKARTGAWWNRTHIGG